MCKKCNYPGCTNNTYLEKYNTSYHNQYVSIMNKKGFCFRCAFWDYQHYLDKSSKHRKLITFDPDSEIRGLLTHYRIDLSYTSFDPNVCVLTNDRAIYGLSRISKEGIIPSTWYGKDDGTTPKFEANGVFISKAEYHDMLSRKDTRTVDNITYISQKTLEEFLVRNVRYSIIFSKYESNRQVFNR